jgi:hypothetical protein
LRPGSEADVSIFELRDGKFDFENSDGVKRTGQKMLANKAVVRRGQLFINAVGKLTNFGWLIACFLRTDGQILSINNDDFIGLKRWDTIVPEFRGLTSLCRQTSD